MRGRPKLNLTDAEKLERYERNLENSRKRYSRIKDDPEFLKASREYSREYQKKKLASDPEAKAKNLQASREYHQRFKDDPAYKADKLERSKKWIKDHPEINAHRSNLNRAKRLNRVPIFFDEEKVLAFYVEAQRLRQETGLNYEVDHIVPLKSKIVSGLHWHGNLQIILKIDNISKGNRTWPDMPD